MKLNMQKGENQIVLITRGLSGSGKTTWSTEFVKNNPAFLRISRDDIDFMLSKDFYGKEKENLVFKVRDFLIEQILTSGFNLVLDEPYLVPLRVSQINKELKKYVDTTGNSLQVKIQDFIDIPLEQCLKRDKERFFHVGDRFIRDYHRRYVLPLLKNRGVTEWEVTVQSS